jgi:uncharacterized RDD family membrane protein YckC
MKGALQLVEPGRRPLAPPVLHHDRREDFTVYQPAGFQLRWYALTLDLTLSAPLGVLVRLPFTRYLEKLQAFGHDTRYLLVSGIIEAVPLLLYFVGPTFAWGQTLGKKIVGIRVIQANCRPELDLTSVLLRETVGKFLSLILGFAGFFMAAFGERKRALHDRLAGTVVISYRER